jgi:hypothetical protein
MGWCIPEANCCPLNACGPFIHPAE